MVDKRYSGISLEALRRSRTVLSRENDAISGRPTWVAEISGTDLRASGFTRTEALRRVREAAASQHPAFGGSARRTSPARAPTAWAAEPDQGTGGGFGGSKRG
jgi:hypothetical protein